MKYVKSFLICIIMLVASAISNAQTLQLTIENQHYSGTDFLFDIYLDI